MTAAKKPQAPVLSTRALNRASLERQLLLRRHVMKPADAVTHLLGLQAQNVKPPYYALAARLEGFAPEEFSALMDSRELVRIVTMRSTIHTHTADDALALRHLVQPARTRELNMFRKGLAGVDLDQLAVRARKLVEEQPLTLKQIREELLETWPDADPQSLGIAARCLLPLVQVTPRGLWRQSGQVALTTLTHWLGREDAPEATYDDTVVRYLAAFGPASVKDFQTWCGVTRMREVFERLRPGLVTFRDENGVELFDLPDAPRPDADTPAPARLLPEFDNLLLSHADRSRFGPQEFKGRTWAGNVAYNVFLLDGFLAGAWKQVEGKTAVTVTFEAFRELTKAEKAGLETEAAGLLEGPMGLGLPYEIAYGPVVGVK